MTEMRTAKGPGQALTRLTLFPPAGYRIVEWIKPGFTVRDRVLHYTDGDGINHETSLPFAIEHIREGHQKTPFK